MTETDAPPAPAGAGLPDRARLRICLVGPGFEFLSGLSVYNCRLANALAEHHDVSAVLLGKLIPKRLYPGADRGGAGLTSLSYAPSVDIAATIDWHWGRSLVGAIRHLRRARPDLLVLQWWTAATMHTYLVLVTAARRLGIPVVIEFHETQDPGEAAIPLAAAYLRRTMPMLLSRCSGALVHNEHDRALLTKTFGARRFGRLETQLVPHGPYDHLPVAPSSAAAPNGPTRLLFFGLIRPYKGVEDLIAAFDRLAEADAARFTLTVVGETWEKWTAPAEAIAASRHRDRIRFVNRYVSDEEAASFFGAADAVVLPYRRGSASGPLQIAMSNGLHVVLYAVGGLIEAVADYAGAQLVAPGDVAALTRALLTLPDQRDRRFADPHSWEATVRAHEQLAAALRGRRIPC